MFRLITSLTFVVVVCTGTPINPAIIGGSDADIVDYPYVVYIENSSRDHVCGGFIVSSEWILTDAWCKPEPLNLTRYSVRSGSALLHRGTKHDVVQWIHHPKNNVFYSEYDFALLQVDPPFEFGEHVAAVPLPDQDELTPDGAPAVFAGWGLRNITEIGTTINHLQVAQTAVFSEVACSELLGAEFHHSKLCVQDPNEVVAACFHDQGGPLVINGTAYGVVLWPGLCADPQRFQVYGRIASVRDWIDATIAE